MASPETHEVLIIGAGPAGAATAYFLAARGHEVLLLDKAEFPRDKTCGDGLSPRAMRVLRAMGLLDEILKVGWRINEIVLFAPNGLAVRSPIPAFGDQPPFALVLPRYQLDDLIRARAVEVGAEFWSRSTVTELIAEGGHYVGARVTAPGGVKTVRARHIVLATGAATGLAERAGLLPTPPTFGRAARAYYEGVQGLSDAIEFHFDSVPLPGYGWVFPISATAANVGAGYFTRTGQPPMRNSPAQVLEEFIANPYVNGMMKEARATSAVKGYPLRFDFPMARVAFPGLMLVGEACGLVNPLTGEGIDYALESAEIAADVLSAALRRDEAPAVTATRYARATRDKFLRAFVNIGRVRDIYLRPWVFNRFAAAANKNDDLKLLLVNIALGNLDPAQALTLRTLWQVARG